MSCPDCFRGGISQSHPTGEEVIIHGVRTYSARSAAGVTPKGIIVLITDAFGWDFVHNRVLCDHYAKRGFLVYCPDFMNGHAMSPAVLPVFDTLLEKASWFTTIFVKPFSFLKALYYVIPWILTCSPTQTEAGVITYFKALRTSPPPRSLQIKGLKISAAGFGWGGKHTVELAKDDPTHRVTRNSSQTLSSAPEPLIDAACVAHPTYIKVPDNIDSIKIPISWSVGVGDLQMKGPDVMRMKAILESKEDAEHDVQIIPSAKHGFAIHTHPEDKKEMAAVERAEEQAVSWFSQIFSQAYI